jgi:Cytochrome c
MKHLKTLIAMAVLCVFVQTPVSLYSQDDRLLPQEQRGKDIYFGIEGPSNPPIRALYGNPPAELPATLMGCVNCHGKVGKGNPEAELPSRDITWDVLTKPYSSTDSRGGTRPAYTEQLLVRAVCMGIDPAGNELHVTMPRFQLSREDMRALIAYLKRLDEKPARKQ